MKDVASNIKVIQQRIRAAEHRFQRPVNSVKLLAVSKGQSIEKIKAAYTAGQRYFAENYVQEALEKIAALSKTDVEWHFIGNIQSRKTRDIAENFAWIHSVSRWKIAQRLNDQRPEQLPILNICIEANVSEEKQKSGVNLAELLELAKKIQQLPRLKLRGLMAIPQQHLNFNQQKASFDKLAALQKTLIAEGIDLDTLSMGMSQDFEAAIASGSTIVRIGTAIFGQRGNHEK